MKLPSLNSGMAVIDLTAIGLMAAFTGAVYFIGVAPAQERVTERTAAEARLIEATKELDEAIKHKGQATADNARYQEALRRDKVRLEPATEVNNRQSRLTKLATKHGLERVSLTANGTTEGDRATVVSMKIQAKAKYAACESFMAELRHEFPDVAITGFTLKAPTEGNADLRTEMTCDFDWYAEGTAAASAGK